MQSTLFRASSVFARPVARSQAFVSRRNYSGSTGGRFSTLHASRKALAIGGGITFVATSASLFAYSSVSAKEHTDEQKSTEYFSNFLPVCITRVIQWCAVNYTGSSSVVIIKPRILLQRKRNDAAIARKILEQLDPSLKKDTKRLQNIIAEVEKYLKSKHH